MMLTRRDQANHFRRCLQSIAAIAVLAATAATMASVDQPAAALTQEEVTSGNCSSGGLKYQFTGTWTGGTPPHNWDLRPTFRTYANEWEDEKEYSNSGPVVDMIEASGEIEVSWVPSADIGGSIAAANCSDDRIRISNTNFPLPAGPDAAWYADMGRVFQHELGHTMGLWHTARYDSDDGKRPIMNTCQAFTHSSFRSMSQEDWQSHQRLNGDLNPETMSANIGFNRGTNFYKKTSGSFWYTSGNYLYWRRGTPNADHKFYQTTAVSGSSGDSYDVRINWRRPTAGAAGTVWASMYARTVTYGADPGTCNATPAPQPGQTYTGSRTEGTTWYFKGNVGVSVPAGVTSLTHADTTTGSMTGNNVDIQLRVATNIATTGGASQYMQFDNVRIRER